jgi:shikimate kinase
MIFLVGFMGSGKSTLGPRLAARLTCEFLDLDARIEAAAGCSINEIFDRQGETAFREIEHGELVRVLSEGTAGGQRVVALGGGAFTQTRNIDLIENSGAVSIWLDAPPQVLLARCGRQSLDRPLARDRDRFLKLYSERLPFYKRATVRVNTAASVKDVVEEILTALRLRRTL